MKRLLLLAVLLFEGIAGIIGGIVLVVSPDGHLMAMPVAVMHGVFPDFLIPGIMLTTLGLLNLTACIEVLRRGQHDWIMVGLALVGFVIWFGVEIIILRKLLWLHVICGIPVLLGIWAALPLIPIRWYGKSATINI